MKKYKLKEYKNFCYGFTQYDKYYGYIKKNCLYKNSNKNNFLSCPPEYPPTLPFEEIILWHGIIIGKGFFAFAVPTALAALLLPAICAIFP